MQQRRGRAESGRIADLRFGAEIQFGGEGMAEERREIANQEGEDQIENCKFGGTVVPGVGESRINQSAVDAPLCRRTP
jgi:hypothetical protein